jgi:hypothetical protein
VNWTNSQPNVGYWPLGDLAWYKWRPDGSEYFTLEGNRSNKASQDTSELRLIPARSGADGSSPADGSACV